MKQKAIAVVVAGGMLVGAGLVTAAVSTPGTASAQEDTAEDDNVGPDHWRGAVLEEVLDDLVANGTIDQGQADAIVEALSEKAEELRAERQETREMIRGFLEDDVITAEELAQLPDGHPFNDPDGRFAEAVEDGELTRDEINESRPHPRRDFFKRGARFGALLDDGGIDQTEYDSLSEDHPLKQIDVSSYLEDGIITIDELREIRQSQSDSGDAA